MQQKTLEITVGLFIAAGLAALLVLALKVSNVSAFSDNSGYVLKAKFENIGGLKVRSPVTVAGVRVGRVASIGFDDVSQQAVVTLSINHNFDKLPSDTSASIFTSGLLGEQYIGLEPGGDPKNLKNGDEIKLTQSALVLEQLIGQFLFNKAAEGKDKQGS
ncbi:MAG TPA: outer membrane lipid asymmetry maintenance protein MlaD [Gammaproteobacteria bacterium]|nr:outer membrane lipid asymmetry maintenance protein MlaD [Gammaproteobacteria bacterium]